MGRQTLLGFVAGVASAVAVWVWCGSGPRPARADGMGRDTPAAASTPVGRYQSTHQDATNLWVADTATGHVWTVNNNGQWADCGSPPTAK